MEKYITKNDEETKQVAGKIIEKYLDKKTTVIFLSGELGAGKTVFVKGLARKLGIQKQVESPTFIFVREYYSEIPLYHFDLYRINNTDELDELGFFDYLGKNGIIAIEWAEKAEDLIKPDIKVQIKKVGKNEREIVVEEYTE